MAKIDLLKPRKRVVKEMDRLTAETALEISKAAPVNIQQPVKRRAKTKLANGAHVIRLPANSNSVVLCLDPARINYGFAVYAVQTDMVGAICGLRMLQAGLLPATISEINHHLDEQCAAYALAVRDLIKKYKVSYIFIERFLSRGRGAAMTAETSNLMIGMTLEIARSCKVPCKAVLAITWKARTKKQFAFALPDGAKKLPVKKDNCLERFYRVNMRCPHMLDAFLIGMYFLDGYEWMNRYGNMLHVVEFFQNAVKSPAKASKKQGAK